jgi:hypothetical protein
MSCSRWRSTFVGLAAIGVMMAMVACGGERGGGESAATSSSVPAGGSGTAESTSVTADNTTSVPASPGPGGGSGSPVPFVKGDVSVKLDAGGYRVGAIVHVTVSNGMDRPIYTEDFKTACSIVTLQRREGGGWSDVTGCALGRPTVTVTIGPGRGLNVEIDPASFHLAHGSGGPAFGAGTYRVVLTYRLERTVGGADPLAAYSPEFGIR